jgi:uncharacterized protein YhhL (DUF1145 family)
MGQIIVNLLLIIGYACCYSCLWMPLIADIMNPLQYRKKLCLYIAVVQVILIFCGMIVVFVVSYPAEVGAIVWNIPI